MGKAVSDPVVVVTGASAGVGRAVARKFAARGDRVALLARGERGLDGAARDIEDAGGVALPIALDVADYQAVQQAAQQVQ
jgi:NADP-dependent 3-hydroxy acid dehydrogenase YdfG